jgi:hypothetical protein
MAAAPTLRVEEPIRVPQPALEPPTPATPARFHFVVDGKRLDFAKPIVAAESGQSLHVTIQLDEDESTTWSSREDLSPSDESVGEERVRFRMAQDYTWETTGGRLDPGDQLNVVHWELPREASSVVLTVKGSTAGEAASVASGREALNIQTEGQVLTAQVLSPFDRRGPGLVSGYPLGIYPDEKADQVPGPVQHRPEAYLPPSHFWRVTEETRDAHLAPHVKLGDLCSVPLVNGEAYIAIRPALITKLSALQSACAERGFLGDDGSGLTILRSYISPTRRTQLQQAGAGITRFTRHLYGDAAMVIVDKDGDKRMDDLNGDGVIDISDSRVLAAEVVALEQVLGQGGLGIYGGRPEGDPELPDTPMVQFAGRGERARW